MEILADQAEVVTREMMARTNDHIVREELAQFLRDIRRSIDNTLQAPPTDARGRIDWVDTSYEQEVKSAARASNKSVLRANGLAYADYKTQRVEYRQPSPGTPAEAASHLMDEFQTRIFGVVDEALKS